MGYLDRKQQILEILKREQSVDVHTLADRLFASEVTIRRDLIKLEKQGVILRSHGKAINIDAYADRTVGFSVRENIAAAVKEEIAKQAVNDLVQNGNTLFLDASSTCMQTVKFLNNYSDLLVMTSGIKTLSALCDTNVRFFSTGGEAINGSYSLIGQNAIDAINLFNADICFISCHGVSGKGLATDTSDMENDVRRAMLKRAKRKVLLVDSSKINLECWNNLCELSLFDDVYCDVNLPDDILQTVKNFHLVKL